MTWEYETNIDHLIGRIGSRFVITTKNNIDGSLILSDSSGNLKSYPLNRYQRLEIDINEMVQNKRISFAPVFIEFRSRDGNIETISIDVLPEILS